MQPHDQPSRHTAASSSHPLHYCHYPPPASQGAGYEQYPLAAAAAPYSRSRSPGECYQYGEQWKQPFPVTAADPLQQEPVHQWGARAQGQGTWYGQCDQSYEADEQRDALSREDSKLAGVSQFQGQQFQTEYSIPLPSGEVSTSSHHSGTDVDQNPLGCHGDESPARGYSRSEYENSFLAKTQRFVVRNAKVFNTLTRETARLERALSLHEAKGEESCESSFLEECRTFYLLNLVTFTQSSTLSQMHWSSRCKSAVSYAERDSLRYQHEDNLLLSVLIPSLPPSLQLVKVGDIMRGHVTAKRTGGLSARVTSFVRSHKFRELSDLDIEV